ncbi:MAG TPA: MFS transporter [Candidatus Limnocylindria bacterium]|nr:MFS transporter [Candidatus Limnocylindria bacterium]
MIVRRLVGRVRATGGPALAVLALISFISSLGISIMLPLLPLYGLSLGATPLQLGFMTSAFAVTNALAQFGTGFLLDRYGARRFILVGVGTYAAANALIATAPTAVALIGYRGLAGLGGGANMVSTRLYVSQTAEQASLAFFNSILSAATSAGNVLGPALGGLVAIAGDLGTPFRVVAVTSTIAFVAALFLPRPRRPAHAAGTTLPTGGVWTRSVFILLAGNLFLLIGFGSWITSYAPFATQRLGWSTFDVGIIFTLFGIGDITLGPWLGHLADRTGRRRMAVIASVPVFLFGFVLVLGLPRPFFWAISFLTGAALTAYNASWFAMLTVAVPAARRGRVFGVVSAVAQLGTIIGALGASAVWQLTDLAWGLILGSLAALAAGLVLLALPREIRPAPSPAPRAPAASGTPASR